MAVVFDDVFGHRLFLDQAHREHMVTEHPEIQPYLDRLEELFRRPEIVKRSRRDSHVYLYYRFYSDLMGGKYLLGVAHVAPRPRVLTCYVTDTVKQGDLLWPRH